jgi:TolB-like protein
MKNITILFLLASISVSSLFSNEILIEKYHRNQGQSSRALEDIHYSALGYVNQLISSMTNQLVNNKDFQDIKNPAIATTSFVSLNNFKVTSELSNLISENLTHEMQIRGFKVIDFKVMENIEVTPNGDYLFSRDVEKLRKKLNVDYALSGTYSSYRSGIMINARIIDMKTQIILSTAQIMIPRYVLDHITPYPRKLADFYPNMIELR